MPVWVLVGHWVGENLDMAMKVAERVQLSFAGALVVLVLGYLGFKRYRKRKRAQRLIQAMRTQP